MRLIVRQVVPDHCEEGEKGPVSTEKNRIYLQERAEGNISETNAYVDDNGPKCSPN